MISTMERRHGEHARIPCAIPVELTQTEPASGFEADAIDLSAGGLSLRASRLPDIGTQLQCSFETVPGGTRISGQGEVVWARLAGERSGEFGLRFTRIEPEAQALIDEMIAERVARGNTATPEPAPRMARLELDQGDGPITAKVTRAAGQDIEFEQPLDLLALGRSVVAHADKNLGQGNIVRVGLRMDNGTPTLALTVRFSQSEGHWGEFGEFEWDATSQPDTEVSALTPAIGAVAVTGTPQPADSAERGADEPDPDAGYPPERTTSIPKAIARSAARTTYERTLHGLPRAGTTQSSSGGQAAAPADGQDAPAARERDRDAAWADAEWVDVQDEEPELDTQPDMLTPVTGPGVSAAPQPSAASVDADAEPLPRVLETPKASQLALFDPSAASTEQRRVNAGRSPETLATTSKGELEAPRVHSSYATPEGLSAVGAGQITPVYDAISLADREDLTAIDSPAGFHAGGQGFDTDEVTEAARRSPLVRFLRILVAIKDQAQALAEQATQSARALARKFASDPERRFQRRKPMSATLRGLGFRPRRTTGLPPGARDLQFNRSRQRLLLSLAAMAAASSIAIYALAPSSSNEDVALHDELQLEAEGRRGESVASAATDPLQPTADEQASPGEGAAAEPAAVRGSAKTSRLPTVPSKVGLRVVESRPPSAAQVPPAPPATLAAIRADGSGVPTSTFGSKQVPNARRFTLRMSAPIQELRGSRDAQGFDVVVIGGRSLDRAKPIQASHKAVSHASILNRGQRAELKIRFVPGKRPAYRVSAQGDTLELLLEP